jgi:hypothetical protein
MRVAGTWETWPRCEQSKKPAYDTDPRPYVPMQLDVAKMQRLTDEECLKLIQEGKCFYCKEDGHLYKECKKRPKSKGKGKGRQKGHRFRP